MEYDEVSEGIIGCAIEVHRTLGPGLLESVYEKAFALEMSRNGICYECQKSLPVLYKNEPVGQFRVDLVVEGLVVVELKSVERLDPIFEAQLLTYMKLGGYKLGLLLNFNSRLLNDGIKRMIL